jgi:DNA-binding winged helix-turn-helix (wHTH) protein
METVLQPVWIWVSGLDLRLTAVLWANGVDDTERFIGSTDYDWLAASEARQLMELKQRVIDTARPMRHQASVSWGGKPHQLDLIVSPNLAEDGSVEGVTCVCFDITPGRDPLEGKRRVVEPADGLPAGVAANAQQANPDRIGGVVPLPSLHALRGPEGEVRLTKTEWLLLQSLLRERGHLLRHEALLSSVWGPGYEDEVSLLHDAVSRLRHRLRAAGACHDFIRTVHGVGYCLARRGSYTQAEAVELT